MRASEISFENVQVGASAVLGDVDGGHAVIERVAEFAVAALCAEAVGCMDVLKEETNQYIKTREQFGQPIGKFQVLQHRMVDILINCEEARSMAYVATAMMDSDDASERARSVAAAKAQIGKSARFVGQNSVQIGMTEKRPVCRSELAGPNAWRGIRIFWHPDRQHVRPLDNVDIERFLAPAH